MATNDFLAFGTDPGANVMSQADYAALAARLDGFASGIAQSAQVNKVWRQSSFMAAVIAAYIEQQTGLDVLDDGDLAAMIIKYTNAVTIGSGVKPARRFTAAGNLAVLASDYAVGVARAAPAAIDAQLPADAQVGQQFNIEDLAGNFAAFPVRVLPPGGNTIAGQPDFTLNINNQCGVFRRYETDIWSVSL
jgi:hypothetical protein